MESIAGAMLSIFGPGPDFERFSNSRALGDSVRVTLFWRKSHRASSNQTTGIGEPLKSNLGQSGEGLNLGLLSSRVDDALGVGCLLPVKPGGDHGTGLHGPQGVVLAFLVEGEGGRGGLCGGRRCHPDEALRGLL